MLNPKIDDAGMGITWKEAFKRDLCKIIPKRLAYVKRCFADCMDRTRHGSAKLDFPRCVSALVCRGKQMPHRLIRAGILIFKPERARGG